MAFVACNDNEGLLPRELVGDACCTPPPQIEDQQSLGIDFGGASKVFKGIDTESLTTDKTDHLAFIAYGDKEGLLPRDFVGDACCTPPPDLGDQQSLDFDFGAASLVFKNLATESSAKDITDHLASVAC